MNVFIGSEERPNDMMIQEDIAEEEGGGESEYTSEEIIGEDIQGERSSKKLVHKTPTKVSERKLSGSKKSLNKSETKHHQRTQDSIPELL
jgi:hypothetical protein